LAEIAAAAPADPRLLSLVPPGAQLVSATIGPWIQGKPNNFIVMTQNNWVDLQDFFALTGADDTMTIHQLVFVAVASKEGQPEEHSLLVSGHFNQRKVFKSAVDGGAAVSNYGRIPVLEVQPFAREHGMFKGVRWLAVLDSSELIFGSVAAMRLELDRYLAQIHTDESLVRQLARLRSKDQTWCLLSSSSRTLHSLTRGHEIHDVLAELSPELAEFAQSGNELEFGLYFGRQVEFDYEVTLASTESSRDSPDSLEQTRVERSRRASLLTTLNAARDANSLHGMIQISMSHYKAWLAGIRAERNPTD
jgi:hypothetical protein